MCILFKTSNVSPPCNRYATQVVFKINELVIARRADSVRQSQAHNQNTSTDDCSEISDAGKAKVRYIAGACLSTVTKRLKVKALSDITNTINSPKRRYAYAQQRIIGSLRISEANITAETSCPTSLTEIQRRQAESKSLYHIPDRVFDFFINMHTAVTMHLCTASFDLNGKKTFFTCRETIFNNDMLKAEWFKLFPKADSNDETEQDLSERLVLELFLQVCEHYVRISFVEALHAVKEQLPKTKKQALRAKVAGATKTKCVKPASKRKSVDTVEFKCPVCDRVCIDNPTCDADSSIGCDGCDRWHHQSCAKVEGVYKRKEWFCEHCARRRC